MISVLYYLVSHILNQLDIIIITDYGVQLLLARVRNILAFTNWMFKLSYLILSQRTL